MSDTILIGGQPDYLTAMRTDEGGVIPWQTHGREITSGDAEKTLDLTPSVRHRAPSVCNGEFRYYERYYADALTLSHMIGCIVSNLDGVGARARMVAGTSSGTFSQVTPNTTLVDSTNLGAGLDGSTVAQDPFGAISTYAVANIKALDWNIEVGFNNAVTLHTIPTDDPADRSVETQAIHVYLEWEGLALAAEDTLLVTIEVKEDDGSPDPDDFPVRASKTLRLRASEDGENFITAVWFDPLDFDDSTCNDMTVRVSFEGVDASKYWKCGAISWQRHRADTTQQDTGWISAETVYSDPLSVGETVQIHHSLPFLDGDGDLTVALGDHVFFMVDWDDSIDYVPTGRPRIFFDHSASITARLGTPTTWRPEIGLIAEGPAAGTPDLEFGYTVSWIDPSMVVTTIGGNRWVKRLQPYRRIEASMHEVEATEAATRWIASMRRAGVSMPFILSLKTGNDDISAQVSMYAYLASFSAVSTRKDSNGEWFQIKMVFEECL